MHLSKLYRTLTIAAAGIFAFGVGISQTAARGPTTAPAKQPGTIRIVLAGDSTVKDIGGWGKGFAEQLTGHIECINEASGGQSTKSFKDQGVWEIGMKMHPDYVLIQFGHNDMPGKGPQRETDPQTTYYANLKYFVDDARARGVQPVLVTSLSRREWQPDGTIHSTLTPYADAMKRLATEEKVPLIDLHSESIKLFEKLGAEGTNKLSAKHPTAPGKFDGTHLSEYGGEVIGRMVAADVSHVVPDLATYVQLHAEPTTQASAN